VGNLKQELQNQLLTSLKGKADVRFVQVGSNDGVKGDPIHELIMNNPEWKGMFIEPVKFLFDRLVSNYDNADRFTFVNKAIGDDDEDLDFYYVDECAKEELKLPFFCDQLGSFSRDHILKHFKGVLEPFIRAMAIKTISLQKLLRDYDMEDIDLLHVDAEGYDFQVLCGLDFSHKPSVILYEHKHLCSGTKIAAEALLRSHGYACTEHRNDTLAVLRLG
jgi:FkbM family methyltransferase